jgi:probable phosphoglycerate mutase
MDLFLVRHGETQANADGIIQGWLNTELNDKGHGQAKEAAATFNHSIDAIFSSDLTRATQTAAEFRKKYPNVPYFEDPRLRERNFGDASGEPRANHDWEAFWASEDSVPIPNAEILDDYNARVQSFLDSLRQSAFLKPLIVTHSGTINRIQDLTGDSHEPSKHGNASVTQIHIENPSFSHHTVR